MTVTASSMAVDYTRLLREFCRFVGYDEDNLTDLQESDFEDCLRTAINQVFHPPLIPTLGAQIHQWSWARPVWTMETADGQRRYTLPIDFERFVGPLNFQRDEGEYHELEQYPAAKLQHLDAAHNSTGTPACFAIEPVATEGTEEQVWQLVIHPTPDGSYKLVGQYQIGSRMLSADYPYPPGGPAHGELWIASLLAAAEAKLDDDNTGQKHAAFMQRLMADVSVDMQRQPIRMGYGYTGIGGRFASRSAARRALGGLTTGHMTYDGGTDL